MWHDRHVRTGFTRSLFVDWRRNESSRNTRSRLLGSVIAAALLLVCLNSRQAPLVVQHRTGNVAFVSRDGCSPSVGLSSVGPSVERINDGANKRHDATLVGGFQHSRRREQAAHPGLLRSAIRSGARAFSGFVSHRARAFLRPGAVASRRLCFSLAAGAKAHLRHDRSAAVGVGCPVYSRGRRRDTAKILKFAEDTVAVAAKEGDVQDDVSVTSPSFFAHSFKDGVHAFHDFFLFIKDYGWSLRYRMQLSAESELNIEEPLRLDWVKLHNPVRNPEFLFELSSEELFDWNNISPPKHTGFMYRVTPAVPQGPPAVEAVIKFLEGKGAGLLVSIQDGIRLQSERVVGAAVPSNSSTSLVAAAVVEKVKELGAAEGVPSDNPPQSEEHVSAVEEKEMEEEGPRPVSHCWVETSGKMVRSPKSIAFYDLQEVVARWQIA
eukprot:TRINITY_DN2763_c1_g1_i1.p1 TRINITY_DN2763_c1_g1~~TRINITY_DN2763_c1_g1_i1.p1  ORF type:complete len:436 (-),score=70.08 TRINITY_DN2763_c1_g1_i1:108-1415(-)